MTTVNEPGAADGTTGRPTILAAAFSARQIAASAKLAGIDTLAVDFFGDLDLEDHAKASTVLRGHYPDGFSGEALIESLERLAEGETPLGFVYGAGFEDRPELLAAIGTRWPILGTDPETARRLKDPEIVAEICRAAGAAHPAIQRAAPNDPGNWLSKQVGGCGGSHVRLGDTPPSDDRYYQRFVRGERISMAFVAAGTRSAVIGYSRQWADASPDEPFRYGGAVGPIPVDPQNDATMREAVTAVLHRLPLKGLCSADFVIGDDGIVLLELNARCGATLDVFEDPARPLVALHLAALRGSLPETLARPSGPIRATGLAWARQPLDLPAGFAWPTWTRDRTAPPGAFAAGQPICTIVAEASSAEAAERLFHDRTQQINDMLGSIAA
ncbi:ATP-grasp domain-containing protein [Jiella sp. MQZ9-1]|uniref:ATP-grasp domain-containing protein n=1 Tax=Jiella flava TaxID=2816857 RepID=A0A939G037_9HYPH|nr:ATP-grasp domain-containing protein [Jiella flava]MBO0663385.1 ATP-grasp domain-containing protein [Jiella flava]MCD2471961.1 ATP-grasp domain-containing protein [Jiella flava]